MSHLAVMEPHQDYDEEDDEVDYVVASISDSKKAKVRHDPAGLFGGSFLFASK